MSVIEIEDAPRPRIYARNVLSNCPECDGDLTVLRVIGGRAGREYWTWVWVWEKPRREYVAMAAALSDST